MPLIKEMENFIYECLSGNSLFMENLRPRTKISNLTKENILHDLSLQIQENFNKSLSIKEIRRLFNKRNHVKKRFMFIKVGMGI